MKNHIKEEIKKKTSTKAGVKTETGQSKKSIKIKVTDEMLPFGVMPPNFDETYVAGAVEIMPY